MRKFSSVWEVVSVRDKEKGGGGEQSKCSGTGRHVADPIEMSG